MWSEFYLLGFIFPWLLVILPLIPFFTSIALYPLAVITPYRFRWIWLPPLLYCHQQALDGSAYWPLDGIDSLWGLLICIWACHSLSFLFLEDDGAVTVDGKGPYQLLGWRGKFWATWNNPRRLFTSLAEARGRPVRLPAGEDEHRFIFAVRRSAKLGMYWLASEYVQSLVLPGPFMPMFPADFDETRQVLLRRLPLPFSSQQSPVTLRELALRGVFAIHWAAAGYMLVDGAHTALSLFFVVLVRANRPHEWPPIYGSIRHATSLRGFWGQFWHRLVVVPYGNVGKLLAERCLGFRAGSLPAKLIVACCIFVLSGVMHAVVAWELSEDADICWHLDIGWFFLNFVACAVESFVCSAYKLSWRRGTNQLSKSLAFLDNTMVRRCLGSAWVFLFFFWSVPKWQYPKLHSALVTELAMYEERIMPYDNGITT